MRAFLFRLQSPIVLALGVTLAGVFELIDQPTMITLIVVLTIIGGSSCAIRRTPAA